MQNAEIFMNYHNLQRQKDHYDFVEGRWQHENSMNSSDISFMSMERFESFEGAEGTRRNGAGVYSS